jgi:hypothetical protein
MSASGNYYYFGLPLEVFYLKHGHMGDMVIRWYFRPEWAALMINTMVWSVPVFVVLFLFDIWYRRVPNEKAKSDTSSARKH